MNQKTLFCLDINWNKCYLSCVPSTSEEMCLNSKETEGQQRWAKVWNQLEKHKQLEKFTRSWKQIDKTLEEKSLQAMHSGSWFSDTLECNSFLWQHHYVIDLFIRQSLSVTARNSILDDIDFWSYLREYLFLHISE